MDRPHNPATAVVDAVRPLDEVRLLATAEHDPDRNFPDSLHHGAIQHRRSVK